ncbi:hypothetical protein Droror1_Dr00009649 [Drosera rotundifolia]
MITKKVLSRGEFTVTDVSRNLIFKVKGSFFSAADRPVLKDAAGIPILTFRRKLLSAHSRRQVLKGDNMNSKDIIFSVKVIAVSIQSQIGRVFGLKYRRKCPRFPRQRRVS